MTRAGSSSNTSTKTCISACGFKLADAKAQLDRVGKRFWSLTRFILDGARRFDDTRSGLRSGAPAARGHRERAATT